MKKTLLLVLLSALVFGAVACSQPAGNTTVSPPTTSTQVPATEPAETLSPEEAALANASTGDELRALVAQYKQAKNHEALYAAALKLVEVDPLYTPGYTDAVTALLEMSKTNYAEIDRILALGIAQGKDGPGYIGEWVTQNEPGLTMTLPTTPDSGSTDEPNAVGITSGNLANRTMMDERWQAGLLTSQGTWVYFAALNEDRALYRMRSAGKNSSASATRAGAFSTSSATGSTTATPPTATGPTRCVSTEARAPRSRRTPASSSRSPMDGSTTATSATTAACTRCATTEAAARSWSTPS